MQVTRHRTVRSIAAVLATAGVATALVLNGATTPQATKHVPTSKESHERTEANERGVTHTKQSGPMKKVSQTTHGMPPGSARLARHHGPVRTTPEGVVAGGHDEVEDEANSNPTSTAKLLYHSGGAIQTTPRIYLVFWGSQWTTSAGDPYGVANRLHYFYSGLGGSSINNVMKQYSDSAGRQFTNATGQYKGWVRYTGTLPASPTIAQMAAVAKWAAAYMGDYNYNAQYVIALPNGYVDAYSRSGAACAWHNWTTAGSGWVTYTALPYSPSMSNCGRNYVNAGSAGTMDGVTINAWHEYAETVNDPGVNAWYDVDGSENADKCSWKNLANKTLVNGYTFPVQPAWSNAWRTTYGNGCLYS